MSASSSLHQTVAEIVDRTPVYDIHTHLFDPAFGDLMLWGIDELLIYHYLVAESFRFSSQPYRAFFQMPKAAQAEQIWNQLFIEHSPVSEACRGVITTLNALGFDARKRDLAAIRQHYSQWSGEQFVDLAFDLAKVRQVGMTNLPFDEQERPVWDRGFTRDPRFVSGLRLDPLVLDWENTAPMLRSWGYEVSLALNQRTFDEVRRFLADWTHRMDAQYCMVSLTPNFQFPENTPTAQLIEHAIMPHGREHGQAFALMIGVRRGANPQLRMAGDSVGVADVTAVERLCAAFPENKFLCTILARENQHALCTAARKFRNLHIFGCWWFMNNPSLIAEVTRMRMEMLGTSFTPQHSDCRVVDQLIYKWNHSRPIFARVLAEKYSDLAAAGWEVSETEIERDVRALLGGELESFLKR
ncbi:MAG TPA: glucuronate isomerase [Chthoniobacteraceae bacterium]|jgi:hypothetical protein